VNKKNSVKKKDKKDWLNFIQKMGRVHDKDKSFSVENKNHNKIRRLDLHGVSLDEANKIVKKFINSSKENGFKKIIIVTGKGSRSKVYDDPYRSEKMNVLRYSIPEYIQNDDDLSSKIVRISQAEKKDGGEGAIYVFLKS
tara:strand:- start:1616 stop:2035 length:420 start_codon:yes stop_codon:yes gene_type:complete